MISTYPSALDTIMTAMNPLLKAYYFKSSFLGAHKKGSRLHSYNIILRGGWHIVLSGPSTAQRAQQ